MVLVGVALLTGCGGEPEGAPTTSASETPTSTSTPTPDPTRPALADLELSTEGLGTLRIGGTLPDTDDPSTAMVAWDPDVCASGDLGISASDPRAGGYATDPSYLSGSILDPFYIGFTDPAVLTRIDVRDGTIPTDGGLRVGDPTSAVLTAHPDAALVLDRPLSDVYQVTGTAGILLIEVSTDSGDGYWAADELDKVIDLIVVPAGSEPFGIAAGDNVVFGCSYTG